MPSVAKETTLTSSTSQTPTKVTAPSWLIILIPIMLAVTLASIYLTSTLSAPPQQAQQATYEVLSKAEFRIGDSKTGQWQPVEFPFHWRHHLADTAVVWYRFQLNTPRLTSLKEDQALLGVYLWRLNQTADVYINDTLVGTGGGENVRHWNSPLYFTIPTKLIQSDSNELLIRHYASHGWGSMQPLIVGADADLRARYETRYFIQHDLAFGLFVFVALTGIFCLAVWYYGRREPEYLWFAIASMGSGVYCANQFIHYLWLSADAWRWLTNVSTDLWACAICFVILRSLKIRQPFLEKLCIGYIALGIPVYGYASYFQVFDLNIYFHLGSLFIVTYIVGLATAHYLKTRAIMAAVYASTIALGALAGFHDTLMQAVINVGWSGSGFEHRYNLLQFIAPVSFLLIGVTLVQKFISALGDADRLNEELEDRVAKAKHDLEESYRVMQEVLIKQSASDERERIYRDLHDDVGSKLLSLYYRLEDETNSTLAKSALEDLRDIVSRRSMNHLTLAKASQQWHSEASSRTKDANIQHEWLFDAADRDLTLDQSQQAQLRRMLRETYSNAILHSTDVSHIRTRISVCNSHLSVSVCNDGVTQPASEWEPGRGISNLRIRARDLGGTLYIDDKPEGQVQVSWTIPLVKPGAAAGAKHA